MTPAAAREAIIAQARASANAQRARSGRRKTQYRLHDWCISRQRYWGPPIPIIYCDACGAGAGARRPAPGAAAARSRISAPTIPASRRWRAHAEWYHVPCPQCGKPARRETDVSDTFLDSAWYFLRYPSTEFDDRAVRRRAHAPLAPGARTTSAATSTRCCTCSIRASSRWCCTTPGMLDVRGAVPPLPRPWADHQGRRQDVEVEGERGHPRRVHRALGRRHVAHVPDVPGTVPGRRRLPRRRHQRPAPLPRPGLGPGDRRRPIPIAATPRSSATC